MIKEIEWLNLNEAAQTIHVGSQMQVSDLEIMRVRDLINIKSHLKILADSFVV
jgi:hypothetical protein